MNPPLLGIYMNYEWPSAAQGRPSPRPPSRHEHALIVLHCHSLTSTDPLLLPAAIKCSSAGFGLFPSSRESKIQRPDYFCINPCFKINIILGLSFAVQIGELGELDCLLIIYIKLFQIPKRRHVKYQTLYHPEPSCTSSYSGFPW